MGHHLATFSYCVNTLFVNFLLQLQLFTLFLYTNGFISSIMMPTEPAKPLDAKVFMRIMAGLFLYLNFEDYNYGGTKSILYIRRAT